MALGRVSDLRASLGAVVDLAKEEAIATEKLGGQASALLEQELQQEDEEAKGE